MQSFNQKQGRNNPLSTKYEKTPRKSGAPNEKEQINERTQSNNTLTLTLYHEKSSQHAANSHNATFLLSRIRCTFWSARP